jgi:hypothetical protein
MLFVEVLSAELNFSAAIVWNVNGVYSFMSCTRIFNSARYICRTPLAMRSIYAAGPKLTGKTGHSGLALLSHWMSREDSEMFSFALICAIRSESCNSFFEILELVQRTKGRLVKRQMYSS